MTLQFPPVRMGQNGMIRTHAIPHSMPPVVAQGADTVRFGSAKPAALTQDQINREFQQAGRAFANKLNQKLSERANKENTVYSPASVWNLLVVLLNGAEGSTRQELLNVMGLDGLADQGVTIEQLTQANLDTQNLLGNIENITLESAYGVWNQDGEAEFRPEFADRIRKMDGEVSTFKPGDASGINQWASDKTNGMIKDLLKDGDLKKDTLAVLANALYLKANWSNPFDKAKTKDEDFKGLKGTTKVPMMRLDGEDKVNDKPVKLAYAETEDAQIVKLPYGEYVKPKNAYYGQPEPDEQSGPSNQLSMTVILPKKSLAELSDKLNQPGQHGQSPLEALLQQARYGKKAPVELFSMPVFKAESEIDDLKEILETLGLSKAFTDNANFSAMMADPTKIDKIKQLAKIDVNEEGTEAAAVTVAVMVRAAGFTPPPKPINMKVDKPFMYVITDEVTGQNLFVGTITDLK